MSTEPDKPELVEVNLIGIPLELQRRASEHNEGLRREFQLLVVQGNVESSSVPARLVALAADLDKRFQSFGEAARAEIEEAHARGDKTIDLKMMLPREVGPAARTFGELIEEADAYCASGEHLLTLAAPEDIRQFRTWALGEFTRQLAGDPPSPWPEASEA